MRTFDSELIFLYNADSGLFNAMSDFAHKLLSPSTYSCSLCMLTYGNAGMTKEWRTFLESLPFKKTFLHKDEVQNVGIESPEKLPAILLKDKAGKITQLVSAQELNQLQSMKELIQLLLKQLKRRKES